MTGRARHLPVFPGCAQSVEPSTVVTPHVKPVSTVQVAEQPSPEEVLPSSQPSLASTLPLPQLTSHAWVVAPVRQAGSFVQAFVQPVPSPNIRPFGPLQPAGNVVLLEPQSQASVPSLTPLPQKDLVQTLGVPVHEEPASIAQIGEQPSPEVVLPSSHCSDAVITPLPHRGTQRRPGAGQVQLVSTLP